MSKTKYDIELLINRLEEELKERKIRMSYERPSVWKRMMMGLGILEELKYDAETRILWVIHCAQDKHNFDRVTDLYGSDIALDFACTYGVRIQTESDHLRDSFSDLITPTFSKRAHNILTLQNIVDGVMMAEIDDAPYVTQFECLARKRASLYVNTDIQLEKLLDDTLSALSATDEDEDEHLIQHIPKAH